MNKTELINVAAETAKVSRKDTVAVINAVFDLITKAMADGEKVQISGFGTFEIRERKAREGINPRTGERVAIAACKVPAFKAGTALKDKVNK